MTDSRDKEIVLASEEVQRRNIKTMIQHGNESRQMIRELTTIVDTLQNQIITMGNRIQQLNTQLASLQQQFYLKGTVSYNEEK